MSERVKRDYVDEHEITWLDPDGTLHFDAVKACTAFGYPPTAENQATMEAAWVENCAMEFPGVSVRSVNDLL